MWPIDPKRDLMNERHQAALGQARADGLIGGPDAMLVDVVVSACLVDDAKQTAGVSSDAR